MYQKEMNGEENLVCITKSKVKIWLNFTICYLIMIKKSWRIFSNSLGTVSQCDPCKPCSYSIDNFLSKFVREIHTLPYVCFLSFCLSFLICTYQITKQHCCRGYSRWDGNRNKTTECKAPPVDRSDVRTVRRRQHNSIVLDSISKYEATVRRLEMMEWDLERKVTLTNWQLHTFTIFGLTIFISDSF